MAAASQRAIRLLAGANVAALGTLGAAVALKPDGDATTGGVVAQAEAVGRAARLAGTLCELQRRLPERRRLVAAAAGLSGGASVAGADSSSGSTLLAVPSTSASATAAPRGVARGRRVWVRWSARAALAAKSATTSRMAVFKCKRV